MVQYKPAPDARSLLPPLLACLPTAFASPRPAPALLPLLSPILRQRVQLLSAETSSSGSWLPLLCWSADKASKLPDLVANESFELHPVSGEVEYKDVEPPVYRRLDEETLQARLIVSNVGLDALYLWCVGDHEGGGDGWRVGELRPLDDDKKEETESWHTSISTADEYYNTSTMQIALGDAESQSKDDPSRVSRPADSGNDESDDDAYWGRYDETPARTPGGKRSPAPPLSRHTTINKTRTSDEEYYAQYNDVQPALDDDDPSGEALGNEDSTLKGNEVTGTMRDPEAKAEPEGEARASHHRRNQSRLDQPRPSSSSSSHGSVVLKLEDRARLQSQSEMGIQQHIGSSIKSLYRLARVSGMEREEFERLVQTELGVLSMMDGEAD